MASGHYSNYVNTENNITPGGFMHLLSQDNMTTDPTYGRNLAQPVSPNANSDTLSAQSRNIQSQMEDTMMRFQGNLREDFKQMTNSISQSIREAMRPPTYESRNSDQTAIKVPFDHDQADYDVNSEEDSDEDLEGETIGDPSTPFQEISQPTVPNVQPTQNTLQTNIFAAFDGG